MLLLGTLLIQMDEVGSALDCSSERGLTSFAIYKYTGCNYTYIEPFIHLTFIHT